jgi:hypothetical protein
MHDTHCSIDGIAGSAPLGVGRMVAIQDSKKIIPPAA